MPQELKKMVGIIYHKNDSHTMPFVINYLLLHTLPAALLLGEKGSHVCKWLTVTLSAITHLWCNLFKGIHHSRGKVMAAEQRSCRTAPEKLEPNMQHFKRRYLKKQYLDSFPMQKIMWEILIINFSRIMHFPKATLGYSPPTLGFVLITLQAQIKCTASSLNTFGWNMGGKTIICIRSKSQIR